MNQASDPTIVLSRQQVREVDRIAIRELGIPGIVLMENAGRGIADRMCQIGIDGPIVILCGPGNNGGDGFVVARHLYVRGFDVTTILAAPVGKVTGDAGTNLAIHQKLQLTLLDASSPAIKTFERAKEAIGNANWVVDALLGTGASGAPRGVMAELIDTANASAGHRLAIDIPTGLDCDSGVAAGTVFHADFTTTLAALKPALSGESRFAGRVSLHDIGIPRDVILRATS